MKPVLRIAQIVMGVIFVGMGINGFIQFIPLPTKGPEAQAFLQALAQARYFWPFEKLCEIVFGGMLVMNRYAPFAVEALAPIILNIILFHLFLDLAGIGLALVVLVCEIILVVGYWREHLAPHFRQ